MVGRADMGRQRSNNEDSVGLEPQARPWPVAVLADGMGGYNAGEVASVMAVELITTSVQHGPAPMNPCWQHSAS
jgi:Serine/threonine protein phosphatase